MNGAGTGDSSKGTRRLLKSNAERIKEFAASPASIPEATASALGSTAYALTHLRRTIAEKKVIQSTDIWGVIDDVSSGVNVTVFHALDDELISFSESSASAATRNNVEFILTQGGHSNIYEPNIQDLIVSTLTK